MNKFELKNYESKNACDPCTIHNKKRTGIEKNEDTKSVQKLSYPELINPNQNERKGEDNRTG